MTENEQGLAVFARAADMFTGSLADRTQQTANRMERIFARTGARIGTELAKAARTGEISFSSMVEHILKDLARIAVQQAVGNIFSSGAGAGPMQYGGARAAGGPVVSGMEYLVGEHGPEIFRPNQSGQIEPGLATAPVTVHFHMQSQTQMDEFKRSSAQISAMLSRAVMQGGKRL